MALQVAILAAGLGTRLGKPFPKPLTPLVSGQTILRRAIGRLRDACGADVRITVVVGFKPDLIMEAAPDVLFAYNELFDQTNTSKSLLKALRLSADGGVLWMNGDVVFDDKVLHELRDHIAADRSFICVNTASVAEEEVKYTLDEAGHVAELSKQVKNGLGEAVGINYVAAADKAALVRRLDECGAQDYFERGIELTIGGDRVDWDVVDISSMQCIEVDFDDDLERVNAVMGGAAFDARELSGRP
jgi:choline kinase